MKNSQLKGIPVISIAEGKKVGTIQRVLFDAANRKVVGFDVLKSGGMLSLQPERGTIIDTAEVHSLGPDALMVNDESALRGEESTNRYDELVDLDSLTTHKAVTEGGTQVGNVASVDIDEKTFTLRSVEISPGFFQSNREVAANQVTSVGVDVVVVSDAVCETETTADPGAADGTDSSRVVINRLPARE